MLPPSVRAETQNRRRRILFRRSAVQRSVDAMTVIIILEIESLHLQISGRPEQRAVETFTSDGTDQSFNEGMRHRDVGHRFDFLHLEYPEIGLPLVEPEQWIVI